MSTLFKISSSIRRIMNRAGTVSDDNRMSLRFIADLVRKHRNRNIEIKSDFGKEYSLLEQVGQNFGCFSLCLVDPSDCPTLLWGCKAYKVCDTIPAFLTLPDFRAVLYVGIIDKGIFTGESFKYVAPQNLAIKRKVSSFGKFSYWTFIGTDMWIIPATKYENIEVIGIRGVAEDPTQVDENIRPDIDVVGCETDYPILSGGEADVVQGVLQELGFSQQFPDDVQNDALDDK